MATTDSAGDNVTPSTRANVVDARTDDAPRGAMMHSGDDALPYLDKALPDAWKAATAFAAAVSYETTQHGLTLAESEIIKVRVSQLNGCVFCLDLHSRQGNGVARCRRNSDRVAAEREQQGGPPRRPQAHAMLTGTSFDAGAGTERVVVDHRR